MTERRPNLLPLSTHELKKFDLAKSFKDHKERINSMCFNSKGNLLVTASDEDEIFMYNVETGKLKQSNVYSRKYGVKHINFTHSDTCILYASQPDYYKIGKQNMNLGEKPRGENLHALRYQSLHDNKYIRYLTGHKDMVDSLCMSPVDDTVLSSSKDKTVRIWDLKSPSATGILDLTKTGTGNINFQSPLVAIDPQGLIFAVGCTESKSKRGVIKLFDLKCFDKGPFDQINIPMDKFYQFGSIKFSPDGKKIMVTTNGTVIYILDAFPPYKVVQTLKELEHSYDQTTIEGGFTPDAEFCYACTANGTIRWWKISDFDIQNNGKETFSMQPDQAFRKQKQLNNPNMDKFEAGKELCGPVYSAAFNPVYALFATGGNKVMNLWIPDLEGS